MVGTLLFGVAVFVDLVVIDLSRWTEINGHSRMPSLLRPLLVLGAHVRPGA